MNAALKAKWIAALRSGEYKQITGRLRDEEPDGTAVGFCCLGVLCEVAAVPRDGCMYSFGYDDEIIEMRDDTELRGAMASQVPTQHILAQMNDGTIDDQNPFGRRYVFTEIADWIEQNIPADEVPA